MSQPFSTIVRRSARARRISVRIMPDGRIELIVPLRGSVARAEQFLLSKRAWIERTAGRIREQHAGRTPFRFTDGQTFTMLGEHVTVRAATAKRRYVRFVDGQLHVHARSADEIHPVVVAWCKRHAAAFFEREVGHCARLLGVRHGAIRTKDQKTLWGSCSRRGNLNFSWRLALAPVPVARYVVAHECAHLVHLNHSQKFWRVVERLCPDYRDHVAWLKKHGMTLR